MKNPLTMAISLILAMGIVGSGVYLMSKSTSDISAQVQSVNSPKNDIPTTTEIYRLGTKDATQRETPILESDASGIMKCVENGKAIYSDQPCGKHSENVAIRETSGGFVSPDRETIADTRARIREDMQRPGFVAMAGESRPATTSNTQGQCYYLADEIKSIDAASNIGQSWESQQQLRIRRLDVRNRMYRLSC